MTKEKLKKLLESSDPRDIELLQHYLDNPYLQFHPRPDNPDEGDEHTRYCTEKWQGIKCVVGGNSSSKTYTTAWLVSNFLFTQPPPRPLTPFYICSTDYPTVGQIWQAKLSKFIPNENIKTIRWRSIIEQHPSVVVLKPDAKGNSWALYFHSYEQGREAFQSKDAGGFWCDEQCPPDILIELLTRCRVFYYPNSMYYSLTPLEFDDYLEDKMKNKTSPEVANLWKFYRLNTLFNKYNNAQWFSAWSQSLPDDMRACRLRGDFLKFEGIVYKEFADKHVIKAMAIPDGAKLYLGVDFGFRNCAVVFVYEYLGNWYVYDELLVHDVLTEDLVRQIKNIHWVGQKVWADWADPGAMSRMREGGIQPIPAVKQVNVGIESVRIKLIGEGGIPNLFIYDNCVETIKEFKRYTWQKVPKNPINPVSEPDKPVKKDDHLLDALRYVIHSELKALLKPWKGVTIASKPNKFLAGEKTRIKDVDAYLDQQKRQANSRFNK